MSEILDASAIAQQVKARIKQVEDELRQRETLDDELQRPRAPLTRLEGEARPREVPTVTTYQDTFEHRQAEYADQGAARAEQGEGARRLHRRVDDSLRGG